jgi:hypothetical protein
MGGFRGIIGSISRYILSVAECSVLIGKTWVLRKPYNEQGNHNDRLVWKQVNLFDPAIPFSAEESEDLLIDPHRGNQADLLGHSPCFWAHGYRPSWSPRFCAREDFELPFQKFDHCSFLIFIRSNVTLSCKGKKPAYPIGKVRCVLFLHKFPFLKKPLKLREYVERFSWQISHVLPTSFFIHMTIKSLNLFFQIFLFLNMLSASHLRFYMV